MRVPAGVVSSNRDHPGHEKSPSGVNEDWPLARSVPSSRGLSAIVGHTRCSTSSHADVLLKVSGPNTISTGRPDVPSLLSRSTPS